MTEASVERVDKKWLHWCEACKTWVAHVNAHGVSENEALLARLTAERDILRITCDAHITVIGDKDEEITRLTAEVARWKENFQEMMESNTQHWEALGRAETRVRALEERDERARPAL